MNKTLFTTAIFSNMLSLLLIHSGLSGSGHGAGAFFMLVFIGIIWLFASVILIIVLIKKLIWILCSSKSMYYFFINIMFAIPVSMTFMNYILIFAIILHLYSVFI